MPAHTVFLYTLRVSNSNYSSLSQTLTAGLKFIFIYLLISHPFEGFSVKYKFTYINTYPLTHTCIYLHYIRNLHTDIQTHQRTRSSTLYIVHTVTTTRTCKPTTPLQNVAQPWLKL